MNQSLDEPEFSRLEATLASLGDAASDQHRFNKDKSVLLTGEVEILLTQNGRNCFLDSLRLLMRMVTDLTVCIPSDSQLETDVGKIIERFSLKTRPQIQAFGERSQKNFDAILSVGTAGKSGEPITVINSNGWVARVSSTGCPLNSNCSQANPVGALGAACLGVAEVFKRLIKLRPERGKLHDQLNFSFYSYLAEDNPGPALPTELSVELLVVGMGAINNGTFHLLNQLPTKGTIRVVDSQTFNIENWGTSVLVSPQDIRNGVPKAKAAETWLPSAVHVTGYHETIEQFRERCGKEIPYPKLIVNGLDKISARRAVQDLWPDQIIDGAIGTVACEVTLHPWGPDLSCLKCDFVEPATPAEQRQAEATGLRPERLADPLTVITEADIEASPLEKREWLRERKGKQVCSVVSEGMLALLSGEAQSAGFEPSVPFVACLSSCMIVSELVRYLQGVPQILETGFQFDVMVGPENGQRKAHSRKPDCMCVTRRHNIELLRGKRR